MHTPTTFAMPCCNPLQQVPNSCANRGVARSTTRTCLRHRAAASRPVTIADLLAIRTETEVTKGTASTLSGTKLRAPPPAAQAALRMARTRCEEEAQCGSV